MEIESTDRKESFSSRITEKRPRLRRSQSTTGVKKRHAAAPVRRSTSMKVLPTSTASAEQSPKVLKNRKATPHPGIRTRSEQQQGLVVNNKQEVNEDKDKEEPADENEEADDKKDPSEDNEDSVDDDEESANEIEERDETLSRAGSASGKTSQENASED